VKQILIVDDEILVTKNLAEGLSVLEPGWKVLTAENGKEALDLLDGSPVHLVATDLKMPVMDGFQLLAYLIANHPGVPAIAMTASGNSEVGGQLDGVGNVHFLEKPVSLKDLHAKIVAILLDDSNVGTRGVTLPGFLRLIGMEKKTCTLKILATKGIGHVHFVKGILADAEAPGCSGENAFREILAWEDGAIEIDSNSKKRKRNIQAPLNQLLLEYSRLPGEMRRKEERRRSIGQETALREKNSPAPVEGQGQTLTITNEEAKMASDKQAAMEKHLEALKGVKGFKAAGVMDFTGDILFASTADPKIDLALVGASFNDIFRTAHDLSSSIGLEACNEMVLTTPKGSILMLCSGKNAKIHFHLIGIVATDGNAALMKMLLEKSVEPIMAELS
jgi:CheY-like chemotaxis protein/predicted regulator of Ras-like GTPase activity (Roadblock/LC7/MglB family)